MANERPDYGVDAPNVVRNLLITGIAAPLIGWFRTTIALGPVRIVGLRYTVWSIGIPCLFMAILMLVYAKRGKLGFRDLMLNMIEWRGDETVLDVGTGRGLLAIGAAKRLKSGKAIGIDIWRAVDLSGNTPAATQRNVDIEGVADRVELKTEDARGLTFPDATFDVVLSNVCLHNIDARADRDKACAEIARVLKPGGTALISDVRNTAEYERAFAGAGLQTSRTKLHIFDAYSGLRTVVARRPL